MSASLALTLVALAATPPKLAAPEWRVVNIPADLAAFYLNEFARTLRANEVDVVTAADMATLLGVERQRALLGCADDGSSCMAELGAALGCERVLAGDLARLDDSYQGSVRVLSTLTGKTVAAVSVKATGQRALADELERAAVALARQLVPPPPPPPVRAFGWIPLVGAAALGAGAGVSFAVAADDYARIPQSTEPEALRLADEGRALQAAGWAMAGVGTAALVGAVVMFAAGGPAPAVTPQVSVTSAGASVGVVGVLP